jgi:Protein of unknown function (DUF1573)
VKRIALAATALFLATVVFAQEKEGQGAAPRIRVEPESFDFGKAAQNKTLRKEFSIRNFGNADLVIESVSTTCGCTAALTDSKVVKPGGTTPLRVSLETRAYKGRIQRSVMVRSNDPRSELVEVKVLASVEAGATSAR